MNRKKRLFLTLIAGAMLTACTKDETSTDASTEALPMTVVVSETPMTDADTGQPVNASTRGDVITLTGLNSFKMNYTADYPYSFSKSEGTWSTNTWPSSVALETAIDFYAYTAGAFIWNDGSPYVSFTVEGTPANQTDLLVAKTTTSHKACGGTVPLSFKHACAAVLFNIGQSSTLNGKSITFTKIELTGIYNSGNYHFNTATWTDLAGSASFTLESASNISIPVSTTSNSGARPLNCGHLFMIPQTLGADAKLVITYSGGTQSTAEISLNNETWEAGKRYTYNIRLGTNLIK